MARVLYSYAQPLQAAVMPWRDVHIRDGRKLVGLEAVLNYIANVRSTTRGERVYRPLFGANFNALLWQPCTQATADALFDEIVETFKNDLPMVHFRRDDSWVMAVPVQQLFLARTVVDIDGYDQPHAIDYTLPSFG